MVLIFVCIYIIFHKESLTHSLLIYINKQNIFKELYLQGIIIRKKYKTYHSENEFQTYYITFTVIIRNRGSHFAVY